VKAGSSLSDHLGTRDIQHFIDGGYTASIIRQTFANRFCLNNLPTARGAEGGDADVDAAVTAARSALHDGYCVHHVAANVDVGMTGGRQLDPARLARTMWWCAAIGIGARMGAFPGVLCRTAQVCIKLRGLKHG
jgi:hypothetical protein